MKVISFHEFMEQGKKDTHWDKSHSFFTTHSLSPDEAHEQLMAILICFYLMYEY